MKVAPGEKKAKAIPSKLLKPKSLKAAPGLSKKKKDALKKGFDEASVSNGTTPLKAKKNASPLKTTKKANSYSPKIKQESTPVKKSVVSTPTLTPNTISRKIKKDRTSEKEPVMSTPNTISRKLKKEPVMSTPNTISRKLKKEPALQKKSATLTPTIKKKGTPAIKKMKKETLLRGIQEAVASNGTSEATPKLKTPRGSTLLKAKKGASQATATEKADTSSEKKQQQSASTPIIKNKRLLKRKTGLKEKKGTQSKAEAGTPVKGKKTAPMKGKNGKLFKQKKGTPLKSPQAKGEKKANAGDKKTGKQKKRAKSPPRDPLGAEEIEADSRFKKFSDAAAGVLKLIEERSSVSKKNLFSGDAQPILLQVDTFRFARTPPRVLRFSLPNSLHDKNADICLIMGDLHKGRKRDTEQEVVVENYKEMLENMGVKNIKEVIPFSYLRSSYGQYELKRRFADSYDVILCDSRMTDHAMKFLGQAVLYRRVLSPIRLTKMVDGKAKFLEDFKPAIDFALHKTPMKIHSKGTSFAAMVGHSHQTTKQIAENVTALFGELQEKFPGGISNIRVASLKGERTIPVPVFVSAAAPMNVRVPEVKAPRPKDHGPVTGELSTRLGREVTLFADGRLDLQNKATPEEKEYEETMQQQPPAKKRRMKKKPKVSRKSQRE